MPNLKEIEKTYSLLSELSWLNITAGGSGGLEMLLYGETTTRLMQGHCDKCQDSLVKHPSVREHTQTICSQHSTPEQQIFKKIPFNFKWLTWHWSQVTLCAT
jgi:hypothetical protein